MDFGVCYYPEHWPESRWEDDIMMMKKLTLRSFAFPNLLGAVWRYSILLSIMSHSMTAGTNSNPN